MLPHIDVMTSLCDISCAGKMCSRQFYIQSCFIKAKHQKNKHGVMKTIHQAVSFLPPSGEFLQIVYCHDMQHNLVLKTLSSGQ